MCDMMVLVEGKREEGPRKRPDTSPAITLATYGILREALQKKLADAVRETLRE